MRAFILCTIALTVLLLAAGMVVVYRRIGQGTLLVWATFLWVLLSVTLFSKEALAGFIPSRRFAVLLVLGTMTALPTFSMTVATLATSKFPLRSTIQWGIVAITGLIFTWFSFQVAFLLMVLGE